MQVLHVLHGKINLARLVLRELINEYQRLDDTQRLEKSNTIMDEVNSYLQIKENLIFPFIRHKGNYDDLIQHSAAIDAEVERISELSIMMHVDEPSGEYYHNMVLLLGLLDKLERVDSESIFQWLKEYMAPEEEHYILTHLKNQMIQESLPSSGLTTY